MTVEEVLARLCAAGSPTNVAGMARYGIRPSLAYGVASPMLRAMAREIRRDTVMARLLWATGVHEARLLATLIADANELGEPEVERWVREFDCWSVCDSACLRLLWKTPFAWRKVEEWSAAQSEYVRRAGFALLASLAVHDKQAADRQFRVSLRLIRKAATDERNYVKKAVNWALRQIGKRNPVLRAAAVQTAEKLAAAKTPTTRWIGSDALRELRGADALVRSRPPGLP
jgi:3-methyladenine DNA glycosylase AlkD